MATTLRSWTDLRCVCAPYHGQHCIVNVVCTQECLFVTVRESVVYWAHTLVWSNRDVGRYRTILFVRAEVFRNQWKRCFWDFPEIRPLCCVVSSSGLSLPNITAIASCWLGTDERLRLGVDWLWVTVENGAEMDQGHVRYWIGSNWLENTMMNSANCNLNVVPQSRYWRVGRRSKW